MSRRIHFIFFLAGSRSRTINPPPPTPPLPPCNYRCSCWQQRPADLFARLTGNESVTSFESSGSFGRGRAVETDAHRGRIGHEFAGNGRAAEIVDLLFTTADRDVGCHVIGSVATENVFFNVFFYYKKSNGIKIIRKMVKFEIKWNLSKKLNFSHFADADAKWKKK